MIDKDMINNMESSPFRSMLWCSDLSLPVKAWLLSYFFGLWFAFHMFLVSVEF